MYLTQFWGPHCGGLWLVPRAPTWLNPALCPRLHYITIDPLWLWFYVSRVLCGPGSMWDVMAYVLTFWAGTHILLYALVLVTTARWSPITQYVVFYPDLLAVGGGTHDIFWFDYLLKYPISYIVNFFTGLHNIYWKNCLSLYIFFKTVEYFQRPTLSTLSWKAYFSQCSV